MIEKVQRRATKLLPDLKNLDYSTRLRKLNLPSLVYRRERADVLQIFRIVHGIDQIDCNMFFELEKGTITLGHSLKIKKSESTTEDGSVLFGSGLLTTGTVLLITSYYQITLTNLKQGWRDSGQRRSPNLTQQWSHHVNYSTRGNKSSHYSTCQLL